MGQMMSPLNAMRASSRVSDEKLQSDHFETYYQRVRRDIRPLLPKTASEILDIGAGVGATLAWLKSIYPGAKTTGVELNSTLLPELKKNADVGDADQCVRELNYKHHKYDLIFFRCTGALF
jgi:trans-aconitate methyltransferase